MAGGADSASSNNEGPRHLSGTKRTGIEVIAAPTFEVGNGRGNHTHVKNPKELIQEAKNRRRYNNRFLLQRRCFSVDHQPPPGLSDFL